MTKQDILGLLSDDEVARVSRAEDERAIEDGVEFVDLDDLDRGVQTAKHMTDASMHTVVPRTAVSAETWGRIAAVLSG